MDGGDRHSYTGSPSLSGSDFPDRPGSAEIAWSIFRNPRAEVRLLPGPHQTRAGLIQRQPLGARLNGRSSPGKMWFVTGSYGGLHRIRAALDLGAGLRASVVADAQ